MNNPFWEQQQQLFKMWNKNFTGKIPGMDVYENIYKSMMPGINDYWTKTREMMSGMENPWKNVFESMPGFEAFNSMMPYKLPGMDVYAKVFELWKGLEDPVSFMQNFHDNYLDLVQEIFGNFIPGGSMPFFEKPQELLDTCVNFYKSVLSPWMQIDPTIMERIATGDRGAYSAFFREFNQKYEESFGKMFNMMTMGATREATEDQMKLMSCYIKVLFAAGEMMGLILYSFEDSMKRLVERYQTAVKEGKMLTTFREFYDFWYSITEETLVELLNTDEFSRVFGDFADKYSKFMIAQNKIYERMLAPLPIPTKTDMDSLYRTVYDLRKEVRDLRREVRGMNSVKESK